MSLPSSVVIPAGATVAQFAITGVRPGVDDVTAEAASEGFETAFARIQVAPEVHGLKLVLVSGDRQIPTPGQPLSQPVVFRIRDVNELPYPGLRVNVAVGGGGAVTPASQTADFNGDVSFRWTPGTSGAQTLTARVESAESVPGVVTASVLAPRQILATVNAASAVPVIAPGSIAAIYGVSLTEGSRVAQVRVDGLLAQVLYASDTQINFVAPAESRLGTVQLTVTALGISLTRDISVSAVSPAIFFDQASGYGAILVAGAGLNTRQRSAQPGDYLEIYATGLGTGGETPHVTIAGMAAKVTYSGPAPGYPGVQQINIQAPADVPPGEQELFLEIGGALSNPVKVAVGL